MPEAPQSTQLLHRVARRLWARAFVHRGYQGLLISGGIYLALLLVSRLTGWGAPWFAWPLTTLPSQLTLATVPVAALLVAFLGSRRPAVAGTARVIDQAAGSRDLYLTLAQLGHAAGEYQSLVVQAAEERAATINPTTVVPWGWKRTHAWGLVLPAAIMLALVLVPQLDPFGQVAQAALTTQRQQRLVDSRQQTKLRIAELQKDTEEAAASPVDVAIDQLKLAYNKMQPQQKPLNLESLQDQQQRLGELWKQQSSKTLEKLQQGASETQQGFGADEQEQMRKLSRELQEGSTKELDEQLKKLRDELQQLSKTRDPVEQQQKRQEIREELERLEKLAREGLDHAPSAAALARALQQLDLSQMDELSSEAMEGAMESLELSEMELKKLAQAAKDMKKLDQALKSLQMAKKLNQRDQLDGKQCQSCKSLKDYEDLYRKMLSQCQGEGKCAGCGQCQSQANGSKAGKGNGPGTGGAGIGQGGRPPEDPSVTNEFETELSPSALRAGKMLMSMKSKGLGENGQARRDYQSLMQQVRQGASEAIEQEQIPPGYHDGIKRYFDAVERSGTQKE